MDYFFAQNTVWQGQHDPEEKLRVIEDRDHEVLVERFGRVLSGQHQRPFLLGKDAMQVVFSPTGERCGPIHHG